MQEDMSIGDAVRSVLGRHADKTDLLAYKHLADITVGLTDEDVLQNAFNMRISPERQGMVLALLAARACVVASRDADTKIVYDAFNASIFKRILAGETDLNSAPAPQDQPDIEIINFPPSESPDIPAPRRQGIGGLLRALTRRGGGSMVPPPVSHMPDNPPFDPRQLGEVLRKIAAGAEQETIVAWFDHHVYTAALKTLGVDVPENILEVVRAHKIGTKSVDLAGLIKDDLITLMVDDASAYLHRCHMHVRHQVPEGFGPRMRGPMGGGGFTPMPGGGFMRFTILG